MRFLIPFSLFLFVFLVYVMSSVSWIGDSKYVVHTAQSILHQGNVDLNEYKDSIREDHSCWWCTLRRDSSILPYYPIGTSLLIIPIVLVIESMTNQQFIIDNVDFIDRFSASVITAAGAVVLYGIARGFLGRKQSIVLALVFAFCTSSWSTASRILWQHGASMLMLSITVFMLLKAEKHAFLVPFVGFPLVFAYVVRPTNSIALVLFSLFVAMRYRNRFVWYGLVVILLLLLFVAWSVATYGSIGPPYYASHVFRGITPGSFVEALAGHLLSPNRGLFIFTPIFLLMFWSWYLKWKQRQWNMLDTYLTGILFLHWVTISSIEQWWGGWSFGPRLFSDMMPFFVYFLIPLLQEMGNVRYVTTKVLAVVFLVLAGISFGIHYRGANAWSTDEWNGTPVVVDDNPKRVWDWQDIQFLR